jgi:hypothetical protein
MEAGVFGEEEIAMPLEIKGTGGYLRLTTRIDGLQP